MIPYVQAYDTFCTAFLSAVSRRNPFSDERLIARYIESIEVADLWLLVLHSEKGRSLGVSSTQQEELPRSVVVEDAY